MTLAAIVQRVRTPRLTKTELLRILAAGAAWGLLMSAGLAGMTYWSYSMICPDDIALTTLFSVATGIVVIGPLAIFGKR
jgi:hypothetical protein